MKTSSTALAVLLVLATGSPVPGQEVPESLSLQEAVSLFARNSPELRAARSGLGAALADSRQSRAAGNPTLSVTNEDLGQYSERYVNLDQPVDFLWERGPRSRRAEATSMVARAVFAADSAAAVLELKRAFVDAWHRSRVVAALLEAASVVDDVVEDAGERVAEGDLAGYDVRRLEVGRAALQRRLRTAEVDLADAERRLGAMVTGDVSLPRVRAEDPGPVGEVPELAVVEAALARRPELGRARAMLDAHEAQASLARRSWLAGTSLTGGFKDQSDGRNGLFLGLHVPLPLLDRRGAATDAAMARADRADSELALLRTTIGREAALAEARLASALSQRELLEGGVGEADELLSSARVAYAEGEVGVVEFVDAAEAFLEARLLNADVSRGIWIARFELEHAIGGFPEGEPNGAER